MRDHNKAFCRLVAEQDCPLKDMIRKAIAAVALCPGPRTHDASADR